MPEITSKPQLPSDWLDTSVGEPHVVRDALFETFDMKDWTLPTPNHCWEYPCPLGHKPLVDLLEHKHGARVVITNGAKQALGGAFYALNQMGRTNVGMRTPYWGLIPPLLKMHGLGFCTPSTQDEACAIASSFGYLLLAPNNPDGFMPSASELSEAVANAKSKGIPFIHDAAYYTHSYVPRSLPLPVVGDVQIYSISKMLGLSNLRVGYAVCPNEDYYKLIKEYVETMTVGVSLPSQMFTYDLMNQMRGYPTLVEKFEDNAFFRLQESKKIIQEVSPEILEIPANYTESVGMFGWFKKGPKADFTKAKVNVIDGALFGVPGMIRMNLAFKPEIMHEIVKRLNSVLT